MKSSINVLIMMFFFLLAGTASAASVDFSANSLKSLQSDFICAEEEKKKKEGEEEPECD